MRGRDLLIGAGVVTAAIGLTATFAPGVFGFSMTGIAVTLLGGLMLLHGVMSLVGADPDLEEGETGDPEARAPMPRPGDEANRMLLSFDGVNRGAIRHRRRIREWVTDAAVSVIAHTEGISEVEARKRIQDQVYASRRELQVIADIDGPGGASVEGAQGLGGRLKHWAKWRRRSESPLQHDVREAVNVVAGRLGLDELGAEDGYPTERESLQRRLDRPTRDDVDQHGRQFLQRREVSEDVVRLHHRETGHWTGMVALAFTFGGLGVVTSQPSLLLAGVAGVGFAAYAGQGTSVEAEIDVERKIDPERPDPGEDATVTLTITNEGEQWLPDVRLVDGVPERLEVVSGLPRLGTSIAPGDEATLRYDVQATRGRHEFEPITVLIRDASGSIEDELRITEETAISCIPNLLRAQASIPLRDLPVGFVGRVAGERGGGVEFYAVREYRPGDPPNRIDWNRHARTGELATLEFIEERSTTVVLLVDTRADAYVAPDDGPHAVDRSVEAVGKLFQSLSATSNQVGIGSFGPERCWLNPGVGHHHERRGEELLGAHPAFGPLPPSANRPRISWLKDVRRQLPEDAQVTFVSPLCDDFGAFVARRLEAFGHPVSVLSPDPTDAETVGGRLAYLQRRVRLLDLRGAGIPVLDWSWEQPIETALRREALRRQP